MAYTALNSTKTIKLSAAFLAVAMASGCSTGKHNIRSDRDIENSKVSEIAAQYMAVGSATGDKGLQAVAIRLNAQQNDKVGEAVESVGNLGVGGEMDCVPVSVVEEGGRKSIEIVCKPAAESPQQQPPAPVPGGLGG